MEKYIILSKDEVAISTIGRFYDVWVLTSDPITVPMPSEECVKHMDMKTTTSSGPDAPADMRVAPATSSGMWKCVHITLRAGTNL